MLSRGLPGSPGDRKTRRQRNAAADDETLVKLQGPLGTADATDDDSDNTTTSTPPRGVSQGVTASVSGTFPARAGGRGFPPRSLPIPLDYEPVCGKGPRSPKSGVGDSPMTRRGRRTRAPRFERKMVHVHGRNNDARRRRRNTDLGPVRGRRQPRRQNHHKISAALKHV